MELKTLYSRSVKGKINEFIIEIEGDKYRTITGFTDGIKTTSQWTLCKAKSYCTAEEQALKEATAIHRKKKETGSFENIKDIDNEIHFEPMLAHKWEDQMSKIKFPVFSQPKLDGIRCIVKKDGMWSRNGKKIVSAPHIFESMKSLFDKDSSLIFDGELYADKFANDFNAICSLVKKTKPTSEDLNESRIKIQYHIYDLPSNNDTFVKRYKELTNMSLPKCCILVKTEQLDNLNDVNAYYEDYMSAGYEGQMIRLDSKYENKRSKSLLKHKSFIDEEYIILDVEEGGGNKTGMVGSFVFKTKEGKIFNSSPKFNWEECIKMWNDRKNLIGKTATVKYFNLTPGDNIPRFPYVTKIDRESYE
jgi:DNA ligase-1